MDFEITKKDDPFKDERDEFGRFTKAVVPTAVPDTNRMVMERLRKITDRSSSFILNYFDKDLQNDFARISAEKRIEMVIRLLSQFITKKSDINISDENRSSSEKEIVDLVVKLSGGFTGITE